MTLAEREKMIDKKRLSYRKYLELAYNQTSLAGGSEGNPFDLPFL